MRFPSYLWAAQHNHGISPESACAGRRHATPPRRRQCRGGHHGRKRERLLAAAACLNNEQGEMRLYILQEPGAPLFKVGVSKDIGRRAKALARKTGPYQRMTALVGEFALADGDGHACERAVHAEIAAFRYGHGREGFRHESSAAFLALVASAVSRFRDQAARRQAVLDCARPGEGGGLVEVCALPVPVQEALRERAAAAQGARRFELQRTNWDDVLRSVFAACAGVVSEGVPVVRWQNANVASFDLERFTAEHPALWAQYSTQRVQRRVCFGSGRIL